MILEVAALVGAGGLATFAVGLMTRRPEIAMMGAMLVIGVGAVGMINGIYVQDGTVEETVTEEGVERTYVNATYAEIEDEVDFPVHLIVLLLGALMLMSSSGEAADRTSRAIDTMRSER